jgi:hypothetical protein
MTSFCGPREYISTKGPYIYRQVLGQDKFEVMEKLEFKE